MLVGEPLERLAIDITGPHPKSRAGHVFILTVLDPFTKWAEAIPIRNHEAATVARVLVDQVFCRLGIPIQILSDRGTEFESQLVAELCRLLEIDKIRTTSYKPSTNGGVERFHRTLNSMLAKVVEYSRRDWSARLPQVMSAYRASKHEATGYSPNFLVYGRELRAPVDIVFGTPEEEGQSPRSVEDFVQEKVKTMQEAYRLVREHLGVSLQRAKRYYDIKSRYTKYQVGEWVWVYSPRRYVQRSPKWQRMYGGPFLIIRQLNEVNYVVQKSRRSPPTVVHIDKLKLCADQSRDNWLGSAVTVGIEPSAAVSMGLADVPTTPVAWRKRNRPQPRPTIQDNSDSEEEVIRPKRRAGRPQRFDDFVC
jgi:transposase InsO family protein